MTNVDPPAPRTMPLYQLFMFALCVLALAGIVAQNVFRRDAEIEQDEATDAEIAGLREEVRRLRDVVERLATASERSS